MITEHAIRVQHFEPVKERQDRAVCMDCDWHYGWNLEFERVERLANAHREIGHQLDYRIEYITRTTHHYIIEGQK